MPDVEKKKILVVEDDSALRRVLMEKLEDELFEVLEATDGISGIDVATREHPHLILLDIFMPNMDGISMLSKLREVDAWGKHVIVLVLTNSTDAETIARATGLGATEFLIKSEWSLEALVGKIREHLSADSAKKTAV